MERGQDLLLQTWLDINQHVAATDEVQARERRVAQEILPGEDDRLPHRLADAIAAVLRDKEAPHPFVRNARVLYHRFGVETSASLVQRLGVEVGRENLQLGCARKLVGKFREHHGQGIGFLARGTTRHPYPHRFIGALRDEPGKDGPFQNLEGLRVAPRVLSCCRGVIARRPPAW